MTAYIYRCSGERRRPSFVDTAPSHQAPAERM
jgi:hypothetical protein